MRRLLVMSLYVLLWSTLTLFFALWWAIPAYAEPSQVFDPTPLNISTVQIGWGGEPFQVICSWSFIMQDQVGRVDPDSYRRGPDAERLSCGDYLALTARNAQAGWRCWEADPCSHVG